MWGFWDEQASGGFVDGWCLAGAAGWWWELLALQEQQNQHSHKPGGGGGPPHRDGSVGSSGRVR